ncbi:MAG: DUF1836 domain-containing protein [Oscillospiraceae bacterium]
MSTYKEITEFKMPAYSELPEIDIYRDQLIAYTEKVLAPLKSGSDPFITCSMINNYVNAHIIPPTEKKRYNKEHIAYVLSICIFKQIYSMAEIDKIVNVQLQNNNVEASYNYFCRELEGALKSVFTLTDFQNDSARGNMTERYIIRHSVMAFALKLHTQKLIEEFLE